MTCLDFKGGLNINMRQEDRFEVTEYLEKWLMGAEVIIVPSDYGDDIFWAVDTDKIGMNIEEGYRVLVENEPIFDIEKIEVTIWDDSLFATAIGAEGESEMFALYGDIKNLKEITDAISFYTAIEGAYELANRY